MLNQIKKDILDPVYFCSMITSMVPRVIEEFFSSWNGKWLIHSETTRKVWKWMATETIRAIIINHLLQSPGIFNPITENMEK